jgi:hypothetical protein
LGKLGKFSYLSSLNIILLPSIFIRYIPYTASLPNFSRVFIPRAGADRQPSLIYRNSRLSPEVL